jgi:ClpP class serine protease
MFIPYQVGSIGVIMSSFGLHDVLKQYGVERRVFTAGAHKSLMDPFKPIQKDDINKLNKMLSDIHCTFIERVKEGRGDRLEKAKGHDIFSGKACCSATGSLH